MCDIWEIYKKHPDKKKEEVTPSEWIRTFTQAVMIRNLPPGSVLSITGGEPFLRKDIAEIVQGIMKETPFAETIIFTNGLLPDRIVEQCETILQKMPDQKSLSVQVSIDGVGEVHNKIRGMQSGFSRAVETVQLLKKLQKNYPNLRRLETGLVIQPDNVDTLDEVVSFRKEMGLPGGYMIQQNLPYFNSIHPENPVPGYTPEQKNKLIRFSRQFSIPGVQKWLNNPAKRPLSCYAGYSSFYIDAYGDVYPCVSTANNRDFVMGNIRREDLDHIWNSVRAGTVRKMVKRCEYTACWSGCEIVQTMVQHKLFYRILKKLSLGYLDYFKLRGIYH
jgi:radical SAM protein with 4Fe4S-binding SPASM domain